MANRNIAYTLGRGWAYIFDISTTSGYMGEKYVQEFGPRFVDMSSTSGNMGAKYAQEFGPRFLGAYPLTRSIQRKGFLHVAIYIGKGAICEQNELECRYIYIYKT